MMKRMFFLMAVAWVFVAQAQLNALHLKGTVDGPHQGKVYLQKYIDRYYQVIDSAAIDEKGRFSFTNQLVLPEIYGISVSLADTPYLVFLDDGNINVTLKTGQGYRGSSITGSSTHDLYVDFHRERERNLTEFIQTHPKSIVPLYILYREYVSRLSSAEIEKNLNLVDASLQQTTYAKILRDVIKTREITDIGQQAPNFTVKDVEGNTVTLHDFIGRGFLLLDFWASWCGPCRKENPNVVKAYNEYKDRGFDVLAVSLDKTREAWLKGIEEDGLKYHHVSELKYWNSDIARLYGIRAIPSNLLIDKNGKIVGKNLRGTDLDEALRRLIVTGE